MYELLTGVRPFGGSTVAETMGQILYAEPVSLHRLKPEVPSEFEAIVGRCLEKDRERRYQSSGELLRDLKTLKQRARGGAHTGYWLGRFLSNAIWILPVFAVLALAVLGYWFLTGRGNRETGASPSLSSL